MVPKADDQWFWSLGKWMPNSVVHSLQNHLLRLFIRWNFVYWLYVHSASITKLWSFCHGLWFQSFRNLCQPCSDIEAFDSINFFDASFFQLSLTLLELTGTSFWYSSWLWMRSLRWVSQAYSLPEPEAKMGFVFFSSCPRMVQGNCYKQILLRAQTGI